MDGGFAVLDAADAGGRADWLRRWRAWPEREPMAHPAYVELFARPGDRAVCLTAGDGSSGVLYPLVLRSLAAEAWSDPGEDRWDATTPYGYGGAFVWGTPAPSAEEFWTAAEAWFSRQGVVASFARLSLFPDERLPPRGTVVDLMPNVVRRLDLEAAALWRDYAHKVRKNVGAARRAGLTFELDFDGRRLDEFHAVYLETMDRRSAAEDYHFSRAFFETIVRELPGSFLFAHVIEGGRLVSTELVLRSARRLYSFLGGTRAESFEKRPNDLLKHEVSLWGGSEGLQAYVLGGGYGGPDGIFRYKLSFAPEGEVVFRVARAVHDQEAFAVLVSRRRAYEAGRQVAWSPRAGFFPDYRG